MLVIGPSAGTCTYSSRGPNARANQVEDSVKARLLASYCDFRRGNPPERIGVQAQGPVTARP